MTLRTPSIAAALSVACIGLGMTTAVAATATKPDVLVAPPGDGERAVAYWSVERMDRARIQRPIVLDPETMEPVARP